MSKNNNLASLIEKVPRDPDGFSPSFDVTTQVDEWKAFLAHYGYVVVKILSPAECAATNKEFFSEVQRYQKARMTADRPMLKPITADDPSSWVDENWPDTGRFKASFPAIAPQALRNRTHPNVFKFYSDLFETQTNIFAHIDVYGFMRATSNLKWPKKTTSEKTAGDDDDDDGTNFDYVDKPEWRSNLPPHFDINPWTYVANSDKFSPCYQGVLAIVDCDDSTGGFAIAPCSARHLPTWTSCVPPQPNARANHYDILPSDAWASKIQHVPIRAGEMVVWDSGSLHTNYPNASDQYRLIQYVRCVCTDAKPKPQPPDFVAADLPNMYQPSELTDPLLRDAAARARLSELQAQMLQVMPYPSEGKKKK